MIMANYAIFPRLARLTAALHWHYGVLCIEDDMLVSMYALSSRLTKFMYISDLFIRCYLHVPKHNASSCADEAV